MSDKKNEVAAEPVDITPLDRETARKRLSRMTKDQILAMCRDGFTRPGGDVFGLYADGLERWTKPELIDRILFSTHPPKPEADAA